MPHFDVSVQAFVPAGRGGAAPQPTNCRIPVELFSPAGGAAAAADVVELRAKLEEYAMLLRRSEAALGGSGARLAAFRAERWHRLAREHTAIFGGRKVRPWLAARILAGGGDSIIRTPSGGRVQRAV